MATLRQTASPAVHTDLARKAAQVGDLHAEAVENPPFHAPHGVKNGADSPAPFFIPSP